MSRLVVTLGIAAGLVAGVVCAGGGAELGAERGVLSAPRGEARSSGEQSRKTLADLPVVAQAAISTAIGRDQQSYHAVTTDRGYRLKNLRHALEAEFTAAGVSVQSGGAVLRLEFVGYGYGSSLQAVEAAEPRAEANRVEYLRGG